MIAIYSSEPKLAYYKIAENPVLFLVYAKMTAFLLKTAAVFPDILIKRSLKGIALEIAIVII